METYDPALSTSRYTFRISAGEETLLYNANTGAVLCFNGPDARGLAGILSGPRCQLPQEAFSPDVLAQLRDGGFLVPVDKDEVAEIRQRFRQARAETPIVLTLTTTMDCNLGCYYCYEERSKEALRLDDVEAVVGLAREKLEQSRKRTLHVDWYGGEPLMNLVFMEAASRALQSLCAERGVRYEASVISNGTCWPEEVGAFIARHRIQQVQISFDGLQRNHDKRRRYRSGYASSDEVSSFDQAVALVDQLLDHTRVDIRLNIDRKNQGDVAGFLAFVHARGWFDKPYKAVIQPARLASFSEHSSFMRTWELSLEEYDDIRALVRGEVGSCAPVEESETPDGFPYPKMSVCAALASDSVVVGADRLLYRCGLQVGETDRATDALSDIPADLLLPLADDTTDSAKADAPWWEAFDPTRLPSCACCSFLPICWGGCPKKHLEGDQHALDEQSHFWRSNLARLVASYFDKSVDSAFAFTETDQFRPGYD